MWWDDGSQQNVYVGTNSLEQSRFRFTGSAKIDKEWSAVCVLEIGLQGDPSSQFNQLSPNSTNANPTSGDFALIVRKSNWYIKSSRLGQIAVGLNGTAIYHLLDDTDLANTDLQGQLERHQRAREGRLRREYRPPAKRSGLRALRL